MDTTKHLRRAVSLLLAMTLVIFSDPSRAREDDLTQPTISLDARSVDSCQLTLSYPKLINDLACNGSVNTENGASIMSVIYFRHGIENKEFYRHFDGIVRRSSLTSFVKSNPDNFFLQSEVDDHLILASDGLPQLSSWNIEGDCGQENVRTISVTPITGPNWMGWMWEQSFAAPKKKLKESCQKFTPAYRCVALVFGNDKMSASFPTYCFLRKKVNDIDTELSFDVFMDMIKTIRFNEGSATELQK